MTKIIENVGEMRNASLAARAAGKSIVLVPTMGFLHDGHRELLKAGRALGDLLVLSIFVNPAQFGPKEDFKAYPRDIERDLRLASEEGVDLAFVPRAGDMYPEGFQTFVEVTGLSKGLCGDSRPGHFRGVATIVLKLFNIVMPQKAVFGRKDYQQLRVIERMVEDLDLPIEITGMETVREADGLAMSSRNSYLSPEERKAASIIPISMEAARSEFSKGERDPAVLTGKVKKIIEKEPLAVVEYVNIRHGRSLQDIIQINDSAVLFIAVKIGKARLIDNLKLI